MSWTTRINHGVPLKNRHECSFHQPVPCTHPTARGAPARPPVDFGGQIAVLSGTEPSLSLQPSPGPFWSEEADVKKSTALVRLVGLHKGLCRCWRWEGFFGCVRRHLQIPSAPQLRCVGHGKPICFAEVLPIGTMKPNQLRFLAFFWVTVLQHKTWRSSEMPQTLPCARRMGLL